MLSSVVAYAISFVASSDLKVKFETETSQRVSSFLKFV